MELTDGCGFTWRFDSCQAGYSNSSDNTASYIRCSWCLKCCQSETTPCTIFIIYRFHLRLDPVECVTLLYLELLRLQRPLLEAACRTVACKRREPFPAVMDTARVGHGLEEKHPEYRERQAKAHRHPHQQNRFVDGVPWLPWEQTITDDLDALDALHRSRTL